MTGRRTISGPKLFMVKFNERGVRVRIGELCGELDPGVYVAWPWDTVEVFDTSMQDHHVRANILFDDQQVSSVDAVVRYAVSDPTRVLRSTNGDICMFMDRSLTTMIGNTLSRRITSEESIERNELGAQATESLAEVTRDFGIAVYDVMIQQVALPSTLARIRAEQRRVTCLTSLERENAALEREKAAAFEIRAEPRMRQYERVLNARTRVVTRILRAGNRYPDRVTALLLGSGTQDTDNAYDAAYTNGQSKAAMIAGLADGIGMDPRDTYERETLLDAIRLSGLSTDYVQGNAGIDLLTMDRLIHDRAYGTR